MKRGTAVLCMSNHRSRPSCERRAALCAAPCSELPDALCLTPLVSGMHNSTEYNVSKKRRVAPKTKRACAACAAS